MKMKYSHLVVAALIGGLAVTGAQAQSQFDKFANAPFKENRPTKETVQTLRDELLFQRATQTYLWALPLINKFGSMCPIACWKSWPT